MSFFPAVAAIKPRLVNRRQRQSTYWGVSVSTEILIHDLVGLIHFIWFLIPIPTCFPANLFSFHTRLATDQLHFKKPLLLRGCFRQPHSLSKLIEPPSSASTASGERLAVLLRVSQARRYQPAAIPLRPLPSFLFKWSHEFLIVAKESDNLGSIKGDGDDGTQSPETNASPQRS